MTYEEAVYLASKNQIKELLTQDQLLKRRDDNPLTKRLEEGVINFKPTFKYDNDSDVYDTSKKMRVPSWTDRILYKPDQCKILYYGRREARFSDHRPVLGIFECRVKKTNKQFRNKILAEQIQKVQEGQVKLNANQQQVKIESRNPYIKNANIDKLFVNSQPQVAPKQKAVI